jgi:UDP-sugar diphosphatase
MAHSGVSCLIYNLDKECLILVKQFRPVVYVNKLVESHDIKVNVFDTNLDWSRVHPDEGFTYELCAGLCDKDKSLHETIREEIMEECGYSVCTENIHKIAQARSVGLFGAMHTSFYTEVRESDKTGPGGGNSDEGEFIELYELPIGQIKSFIRDHKYEKPLGVLYALKWFLYERDEFLAMI